MRSPLVLLVALGCSENNFTHVGDPTTPTDGEPPATTEPPDPTQDDEEPVPDPIEEPIADAGADVAVTATDTVVLDGSLSSDPAGLEPLVFAWSLVSQPSTSTATLDDPSLVTPTLVTDVFGEYVLELTVQNTAGIWDSTPDTVVIDAAAQPPVADAGADQIVPPLGDVTLDGTLSFDPGGLEPLDFAWTMVSQPPGSTTTLNSTSSATPTFFADLAGDYVLELNVTNTEGLTDPTPDQVVITAEPLQGFFVQLSWDSTADLDIHLLQENATFYDSPGDCNWCNVNPNWGVAGGLDNPSLDADAINGFGPETITIDDPADQDYTIKAHYYGVGGTADCGNCPLTTATVDIFLDGILVATYNEVLTDDGDVWTVATIEWPTGIITPVNVVGSSALTGCF